MGENGKYGKNRRDIEAVTGMPASLREIKRREAAARKAIMKAFSTADDEFGATLFVSHHLKEVPSSYWKKYLSTETPEPFASLSC